MRFDLEMRTTAFAKRVVMLCRAVPRDAVNARLSAQAVGAAGSVGANYREANDSLSKKDFLLRLRIARKESKECIHWLELIAVANPAFADRTKSLMKEGDELKHILSAIINKASP